jgi:phage terminase large subunit GpA-like protein
METLLLPAVTDEQPFASDSEREALAVLPIPLPVAWAEENFFLVEGAGYAATGRITLYPWQREPLNAICGYDGVMYCGPVQTGKSLLAEMAVWYVVCNMPMHGMFLYAKRDTVEDVFQDRIAPTIREVPAIRALWDGNEDNLTQSKIKLRSCILRVASAEVASDIATFSAGLIYASEVCKYRASQIDTKSNYDKIKLLRGRQEAYGIMGKKKEILESSPKFKGDTLYREMYTSGVTNLVPKYPCPICGEYQQLTLEQIKEVPNANKEKDHDPERIRRDDAAYYECCACGGNILEGLRIEMGERVVWATKEERVEHNGTIKNPKPKRTRISFQWSRLVDYSFKFSECLARFYEAERSGDPVKLVSFLNEDMGEFGEIFAKERATAWLDSKKGDYNIIDDVIPDGVVAILVGIDTQDKGFYYVVRGYGAGKESWLIDCDYVAADMEKDQNPAVVADKLRMALERKDLKTADGRELYRAVGLIDRGGHKPAFVDGACATIDWLFPYIGSPNKLHPLIKLGKDDIYFGNTRNLSKIVSNDSEKDNWHLPQDIPEDYKQQFVKQYEKEETKKDGSVNVHWISGGCDHYRDCENLIQAGYVLCELDKILFDAAQIVETRKAQMIELRENRNVEQSQLEETSGFLTGVRERARRRGF